MTLSLEDRLEITSLSDRFGRGLDEHDAAMFLSIFDEDVDYRSGPRRYAGKAAVEAFFTERAKAGRVSRHVYSGLMLDGDADRATGKSVWISFAGAGALPLSGTAPYLVADVVDDYARIGGRWLITRREIRPVFRNDDVPPPAPATGTSA